MQKVLFPFLLLIVFSVACISDAKFERNALSVLGKASKEKALKELVIKVMDTTTQWDGKVDILYTNKSNAYTFELSKTGLKYKEGSKTKYLQRSTPLVLQPKESKTLTISIPFLIEPKVAYPLKEDVIVKH